MIDWLIDTTLYTGLLIALVLLVRRPVARWFGPQLAYALWRCRWRGWCCRRSCCPPPSPRRCSLRRCRHPR